MQLSSLPPEILLNILSHCQIQTVHNIGLLSKPWKTFIDENESIVYYRAAIVHHFVEPEQTLGNVHAQYPGPWLKNIEGWKELCQKWFQLEKNWDGRGEPPRDYLLQRPGDDVHRFKLDERREARFVITTHRKGGLRVVCMDTDEITFMLSKTYVRRYAHCEYGEGFLIFDRFLPHALEVWRLESPDWNGRHPRSDYYEPDALMLGAPKQLGPISGEGYPRRGVFKPWALFRPPNNPRAYRFVYPTLLVASEAGKEVYLFDAPSASLVKTLPIPQDNLPPGAYALDGTLIILYVELGPRHVFVCTKCNVLIISRNWEPGADTRSVTLDFPTMDPSFRVSDLVRRYAARLAPAPHSELNDGMRKYIATAPSYPTESTALVRIGPHLQEFTAVHVSPDGKDFVAITRLGIAYFVRDFERVSRDEEVFSDITLRIDLGGPALNLSFEHDRVIITTMYRTYVFSLHTIPHGVHSEVAPEGYAPPSPNPYPELVVHTLQRFATPGSLRFVSCVKHTKTGIWLDWSSTALDEANGQLRRDEEDGDDDDDDDDDDDELLAFDEMLNDRRLFADRYVCCIDFSPRDSSGTEEEHVEE